jgi:hypothetical protein
MSILRNPKFRYRVSQELATALILSQMNPAYTFASYFLKFDFNAVPPAARLYYHNVV